MFEIIDTPYGKMLIDNQATDPVTRSMIDGVVWDRHLCPWFDKYKGGVAIDVGAFIGTEALSMSKQYREVYSFEPEAQAFYQMCGSLAIHGVKNVHAFNKAAYNYSCRMVPLDKDIYAGGIVFGGGEINRSRSRNIAALSFTPNKGGVEAITIDSLGLRGVTMIKIDAQGSDLRVMEGAIKTIFRCRPCVIFEYAAEMAYVRGDSADKYVQFLKRLPKYCFKEVTPIDVVCEPRERLTDDEVSDWDREWLSRTWGRAAADANLPSA